jgi:hypothetical protein
LITLLVRVPMPSMVTATSSPTLRGPTPAGEQRHGLGDVDDQVLDGADHVARTTQLALRAVDRALDGQVARVEVGLHPGAQGAGGVEALGAGPLLLALLGVAGGDVVGAGVAEDDVLDALARDLAAHAADDDGELGLVVQFVREGGVLDGVAGADHRGGGLEEGDGHLGDLVAELRGVLRVVAADGHDLVGEHRRQEPDLAQRDLRAAELEVGVRNAPDDVEDEVTLCAGGAFTLDRAEGDIAVDGESGDAHGCVCPSLSWLESDAPG